MKASFNVAGNCAIYASTACVKKKYAWYGPATKAFTGKAFEKYGIAGDLLCTL